MAKRQPDAYWAKRFELLEEARNRNAGRAAGRMAEEIRKAEMEIDKDIEQWFLRLAKNNGVSLPEARRLLDARELAEFRWTVEEYVRAGRRNGLAYNAELAKQLENASARVHISRLDVQKVRMRMHLQRAYAQQQETMDALLDDAYRDTFWRGAYEIQRGTGVGWQLEPISPSRVDTILKRPWAADGKTFSDRVWGNQRQLIANLETSLVQAVVRGKGADSFVTELAKEMGVARHRAATLAYTEAAYFSSVAQGDCYKALHVRRYRILATLDAKTSKICQDMDGRVFLESERVPGVTAYPFHPRCRTDDVPHFDEVWGERAARGADGKTYFVPAGTTYAEWAKTQPNMAK